MRPIETKVQNQEADLARAVLWEDGWVSTLNNKKSAEGRDYPTAIDRANV